MLQPYFLDFSFPFSSIILFLSSLVNSSPGWHPLLSGLTVGWDKFPLFSSLVGTCLGSPYYGCRCELMRPLCAVFPTHLIAKPTLLAFPGGTGHQNLKLETLSLSALPLSGILVNFNVLQDTDCSEKNNQGRK